MGDTPIIVQAEYSALCRAARIIAEGGVIAFPTDTVYGLGCDLFNPQAARRIFEIKGRPVHMPLIAMVADRGQWPQVAASLPECARRLMQRWWPGPLTLILPARPDIPEIILGGGNTIGVRIPNLDSARQLLRLAGRPLATTSANHSGQPPLCTARDVAEQLGNAVDLIIDDGPSPLGVPSTVLDCTTEPPKIIREGHLSAVTLGLV
ncbi:MAG: L-threonylcarbamoyladenylate synthase [Armatimonadota bacterium]